MKCIFKDIYTLIDTFNDLKVIKLVLFGEYTSKEIKPAVLRSKGTTHILTIYIYEIKTF